MRSEDAHPRPDPTPPCGDARHDRDGLAPPFSAVDSDGCQIGSDGCQNAGGDPGAFNTGGDPDAWVIERAEREILRRELPVADPEPPAIEPVLPGESLGDAGDRPEVEQEIETRKQTRVTVRLTPRQFQRLVGAAKLNGVAPTTMARMLINRGARSIVDEEQRAWRLSGDPGW